MILTEEAMKMALIRKLTHGTNVSIETYSLKRNGAIKLAGIRKGRVIDFSKHFFIVDLGNYKECFKYSQIFEQGIERIRIA